MDLEQQIKAAQELIAKRKEIDEQLQALFSGGQPARKQRVCSRCNQPGHLEKTCTAEPAQPQLSVVA